MAYPVNAMELSQAYQMQEAKRHALQQDMYLAAQMAPYRMESLQANALRDRAAITQGQNTLAFQERRAAEDNALRRDQMASRERTMQNALQFRANALANRPVRPQVIQTDTGPMVMGQDGRAQPVLGPDGQPVKGKSLEKALPLSASQKLMENNQNLRNAEEALGLLSGKNVLDDKGISVLQGDKDATGKKGYLTYLGAPGNNALNWIDSAGVDTRSSVANIGSLVIHDRSGAAVTAAEYPRLRPFIPEATDSPQVARKKLTRFVNEYRNIVQETSDFYKESGYKIPGGALQRARLSNGGSAQGAPEAGGWDDAKESRYQELLRKRNAK